MSVVEFGNMILKYLQEWKMKNLKRPTDVAD
jgi:hypothetical protein